MYAYALGPLCNDGAVRLTDGYFNNNGFAEVCIEGVWIGICGPDYWTFWTSVGILSRICNQQGYQRKNNNYNNKYYTHVHVCNSYQLGAKELWQ